MAASFFFLIRYVALRIHVMLTDSWKFTVQSVHTGECQTSHIHRPSSIKSLFSVFRLLFRGSVLCHNSMRAKSVVVQQILFYSSFHRYKTFLQKFPVRYLDKCVLQIIRETSLLVQNK